MATSIEEQLNSPALDPPPGVTPHFSPNPDLPWFIPVTILLTVIPGVLVLSRLYTKIRILRKTDATEYITSIALLLYLSMVVIGHVAKHQGAGQHMWNLYRRDLNNVLYWFNILEILYCPTIFLVKLAILLQYLNILAPQPATNPVLAIGSKVLIVANLVFYIISLSVSAGACSPREKIWNDLVPGKCLDNDIMIIVTSIWNILSDIVILLLPAHTVWQLRISTRQKLQLISLFAIGLLAVITNAFIIMYLLRTSSPIADVSRYLLYIGVWVTVEICLGLIVVSVLTLPKIIDAKCKRLISAISNSFTTASSGIASIFTSTGTQKGSAASFDDRTVSHDGPFTDAELTTVTVSSSKLGYGSSAVLIPTPPNSLG